MAKLTQNAKVMNWLRTRGELTTREAVTELNIMCLPKRIEELRKSGVPIRMEYRTSSTGARYGVYTLVKRDQNEIIHDLVSNGFTKNAKEKALRELEAAGLDKENIYADVLNVLAW